MTANVDGSKKNAGTPRPPERRGALWPWLVTPLLALALFYVLHTRVKAPQQEAAASAVASDSAEPADPAEPHR
ncbi:MAG TPA: hypothetical protein VF315_01940 [Steroidobacteraceae bacterium]